MSASRIIQYIHRPTLTELGMGNTHDRYLVVDSDKDLSNVFPLGVVVNLTDTVSNKVYQVYSKVETGEFRLKRLGDIVDDYHMEPGDELVITHYEFSGNVLDMLTVNECGRVLLNPGKRKDGKIEDFEIVNIERLPGYTENKEYSYTCEYNGSQKDIQISFIGARKKRSDSPIETKFYSVQFDKEKLDYDPKKYYYLTIRDGVIVLRNLPKSEYRVLHESSDANGIVNKPNKNDLQVVYYGAPGTGKSHIVNEITANAEKDERVFRTTFHPDSDYSTFVGCYKPTTTTTASQQVILDYDGLVDRFKKYITDLGNITHASAAIGYNYHNSIIKMLESGNHTIADLLADAHKSGTTYDTTIRSGMLLYEEQLKAGRFNNQITYKFVPQAFTNAYIKAWNTYEDVFLIIEEINRGNCAQIFGDLFQLLDRKNGESQYPIDADYDLAGFLKDELKNSIRTDFPKNVKEGKKMVLPSNLYIWATMNTSDQSLFPIDSAFKRRWEWKYIKIANPNNIDWKIEGGHDWWAFLQQINAIIDKMTNSADKQLGYFFAKAKDDMISYDTFVSKVCFYLWNDIFKTYALDEQQGDLFSYKDEEGQKKQLTFPAFYDGDGNVINAVVEAFINNVMNWNKKNDKD